MSELVFVAEEDEFRDGQRKLVEVGDSRAFVVNVGESYYAIQNQCLHQGGPLIQGRIHGALRGEWEGPGQRVDEEFDHSVPAVACPLHGWEYDLRTGEHLGSSQKRLTTFDVITKDGRVYVKKG